MTATIKELREAVAEAVGTIEGLRCTPLLVDAPNAPQAVVYRKPWTYDDTMNDEPTATYLFGVTVYVGRTNERTGQDLLDEYAEPAGDTSVKAAIENDDALKAMCDYVIVVGVDEIKVTTTETGVVYLTEDFTVEIAI